MAIQKTEAFVLRRQPFRTSSLIVTTFSRRFGKVKGIAKGVRREGLLQTSTYEPFTLLEIVFYEKIRSELHLISEATVLESFEEVRKDLERLATAYYFIQIVDQLTEPEAPEEEIFHLLHFAFQALPVSPPSNLARLFEIRFLHEIGLFPQLDVCVACGKKGFERAYLSIRQGGFFCPACQRKSLGAHLIREEVLSAMREFGGEAMEVPQNPLEEGIDREIRTLVERSLIDRFGKRLPAARFLEQVRSVKTHPVSPRSSR